MDIVVVLALDMTFREALPDEHLRDCVSLVEAPLPQLQSKAQDLWGAPP